MLKLATFVLQEDRSGRRCPRRKASHLTATLGSVTGAKSSVRSAQTDLGACARTLGPFGFKDREPASHVETETEGNVLEPPLLQTWMRTGAL